MAEARGAQISNVTGLESDAKSSLSDVVIRTSTRERSSAHTISHTAAMTVLAMVATELGLRAEKQQAASLQKELGRLPGFVEAALAQEPAFQNWAQQAQDVTRFYFLGWGLQGEAQAVILSPPISVFQLVSDITRMGEWSPECRCCEWVDEDADASVGASFRGHNQRGWLK